MANEFQMVKKINSITIHYDVSDKSFVENLEKYIKRLTTNANGRCRISLEEPNEFESIHVFVYANISHFKRVFGDAISKRYEHKYLNQKLTDEDLYIVQDASGNIHIASPKGKNIDKITAILTVKILSQFIDEKQSLEIKNRINSILKSEKIQKIKKEQKEKEEQEQKEKEEQEEKEKEEQEEREKEEQEEKEKQEQEEQEQEEQEQDFEINELIETQQDIEDVIIEEKTNLPIWMLWGWQGYVKGKLKKAGDIERFSKYINKKGIIKLRKIDKVYEEEFAIAGVSYIIDTYGIKMFRKIVIDPDNMLKILNTTKFKFDRDIKAYTYSKYSPKEQKMEMDKEGIANITKIEMTSNGSFKMIEKLQDGKIINF